MSSLLLGLVALVLLLSGPTLASDDDYAFEALCSTVVGKLTPCLDFVEGDTGNPSADCCGGVQDIANEVQDEPGKQAACQCIKDALTGLTYDPNRIAALPKNCGVAIKLPPISMDTDCSK
ncbi:hypothetical protein Tsubulata_013006 [Turnera subulata]|uniref:Non-specific lipid-transfer protein n=1 Tax=Turnera subulata TaxID=218843 RepID=A0A9Q0FBV5_9ROSI|nr:hypothetical protein Tsubulata_013006 [Turnera subulata]